MSNKQKQNGHAKPEDFLLPEFEEVELPSGLKAKLRPPSLDMWISYGNLPARLAADAQAAKEGGEADSAMSAKEHLEWAYHRICYLFIEPRFSTGGEAGTFHPSRLRTEDRKFLLDWEQKFTEAGGGAGLQKFRGQPGEPGGDGQSGEAVRKGAE